MAFKIADAAVDKVKSRQRRVDVIEHQLADRLGAFFDRVLRLAWTIADLYGRSGPDGGDVAEALGMRMGWTG